ncbi:MAG: glycogen/starch/alpha-glucan phosphorylase [Synechococcaceae cyanobacterium ELA445]
MGSEPVQFALARHLELIFDINRHFLQQVRLHYPGNDAILRRISIIDEDGPGAVRMANLAVIAAHHVNGVAALHSHLVQNNLFPDFAKILPRKFTNVTNGVVPRRWFALSNPPLNDFLSDTIGADWPARPDGLRQLEAFQDDPALLERWAACKLTCKRHLAAIIEHQSQLIVDPSSLFDIQVKRIHEYEGQHLNALQVITQYLRIKNGTIDGMVPRV